MVTTDAAATGAATTEQPEAGTAQPAARSRLRVLRHAAMPALVFLAVRAVGVLILSRMAPPERGSLTTLLGEWDGKWYLGIAAGHLPPGVTARNGLLTPETHLAFFPGYSSLIRWFAALPGVSIVAAGLLISLVAGIATAYALVRIGEEVPRGSRAAGLLLVALFAASPMGVVLSMAYSEPLFCALAAWSLLMVLRRQWVLAGLFCLFAGLVRPTAAALIAAVGLAALVAVIRDWRQWRAWLGGVLAPLGMLGYLVYVAVVTGNPDGYFALQDQGWQLRFDFGESVWEYAQRVLTEGGYPFEVLSVGAAAGAIVLLGVCIHQRVSWPLLVYGFGVLLLDLGSSGLMGIKARQLLPAFVLLIPVAIGLANRSKPTMILAVTGATLVSGWFGAFALINWQFAI